MADWITPEAVAERLDVAVDDRITRSTAAVRAAVERRRSDLTFTDDTTVPADVLEGALGWAALIYQSRNAPSGYTGYDAETALDAIPDNRRSEIFKLLGWRRPVAI